MIASIIIPTYKRQKFLLDTIYSIKGQKVSGQFEIIVVDNSPSVELFNQIKSFNIGSKDSQQIRYVAEPSIGLHFARHTGALSANSDLLVFCDDDILVQADWLNSLIEPFKDPAISCVSGRCIPHWEVTPPKWINIIPNGYFSLLDYGDKEHLCNLNEWFNGCNFAIRKKTLFDLGGFNPDGFGNPKMVFKRGDGEYGLMRKIRENNYLVMYAPKATIEHRIPLERMKIENLLRRSFNFGIERSYSFFRYNKPSLLFLLFHTIRLLCSFIKNRIILFLCNPKGEKYIIKSLITESLKGTILHSIRLLVQPDLRDFCLRENYFENNN